MLAPIETKRLIMRPFEMEDADALFELDCNEEVMQYVGMKPLSNVEQTREILQSILYQYQNNGIGRFAVLEKESNRLIGWAGLKLNKEMVNGHQNFYEIGYRFLPEFWGKGYATESNLPFIDFAFENFNTNELYAYARIENIASLKVLEKLGFKAENQFEEPDGKCIWYVLRK